MRATRTLLAAAALVAAAVLTIETAAAAGGAPTCNADAVVRAAACPAGPSASLAGALSAPLLAQRAVRCRQVCAQRVRECHLEQRCNYVTGKCRDVQVCTTRCSYWENRPLGCEP